MSSSDLKILLISVVLILMLINTSSIESVDTINPEIYKAFLDDVLSTSKQFQRTKDSGIKDQKHIESPYERVIRTLRTNWEMPMNYLQERGYLKNVELKSDHKSNPYNMINGPLLNPSMSKNIYPLPHGPNSFLSDPSDKYLDKIIENDATKTRNYDKTVRDCNDPSMYNDIACFDRYIGENMAKNMKQKWDSWFHKNQSTTTTSTTTKTPPTTSSTTQYPISNKTTEVISDLTLQDARDGLEFFKIYNEFMLAKLASKLSQDAHERRMLKSAQNQEEFQNPTQVPPSVPDFSEINDNDIKVLKELDLCLKNKKTSTDMGGNSSILRTGDTSSGTVDGTNDSRVIDTYLPKKLKFLAHLHHEVYNIGQNKPTAPKSGCNIGRTNSGTANR